MDDRVRQLFHAVVELPPLERARYLDEHAPDETVNEALEVLGREQVDLVSLVEMRFLAGMTLEEVAEVRRESVSKVRRDVRYALARLRMLLSGQELPAAKRSS